MIFRGCTCCELPPDSLIYTRMQDQRTSHILMVRPKHFGFNAETAVNNEFQNRTGEDQSSINERVILEFDHFVDKIRKAGVHVEVVEDLDVFSSPDAVFPNNWLTTHRNGALITYPMFAENRRAERREDVIERLIDLFGYQRRYSLEHYEDKGLFLEGTGSMVLDRTQEIVYACLGPRTDPTILDKWCVLTGYERFTFEAEDPPGRKIYHTNVMMSVGAGFAVVCLESIPQEQVRRSLLTHLSEERLVIPITRRQMRSFAGNILELRTVAGESVIVMSSNAYHSFDVVQREKLSKFGSIIHSPIDTIEEIGGGSARCMIAELFLPG